MCKWVSSEWVSLSLSEKIWTYNKSRYENDIKCNFVNDINSCTRSKCLTSIRVTNEPGCCLKRLTRSKEVKRAFVQNEQEAGVDNKRVLIVSRRWWCFLSVRSFCYEFEDKIAMEVYHVKSEFLAFTRKRILDTIQTRYFNTFIKSSIYHLWNSS